MPQPCCESPKLVWSARRAAEHQYADLLLCGGCGTTHITETYAIPVMLPLGSRCLNCGALPAAGAEDAACTECDLTPEQARELHGRLATGLASDASFLGAAFEALDQGRQVRALKLATAAVIADPGHPEARAIRLQTLEGLGYGETAARESLQWAQSDDAPEVAWTITVELERACGNLEGAIRAMQRLLRRVPHDHHLWLEYAQLLLELDQRATALDAASHALPHEDTRKAALEVVIEVAQRCITDDQLDHTRRALEIAGDWSTTEVGMLWVRAQLAAREEKIDDAITWLERTLQHDPDHVAAREALALVKKPSKGRWRFW